MSERLLSGGRVENGLQGQGWEQRDQLGAAVLTQVHVGGDPCRAREGNEKWLDSGYISKRANKMCSQTGCGVREKGIEGDSKAWDMSHFQTRVPVTGQRKSLGASVWGDRGLGFRSLV